MKERLKTFRCTSCIFTVTFILLFFTFAGCSKKDSSVNPEEQQKPLSGKLLYEWDLSGIHQFDFSTMTDTKLMDGHYPSLLPDGKIVFVSSNVSISIASADGSEQNSFLRNADMLLISLQASRDGNYIAFTNINSSNGVLPGTFVYKLDGTKVAEFHDLFNPSWTPDGRLVMSGSYELALKPRTTNAGGLYITDKSLKNTSRIDPGFTEPLMPSVSPDGKQVAFIMDKHVWKINLDGTGELQITKGNSEEYFPSWSPDGKYIAFDGYLTCGTIGVVSSSATTEVNDKTSYWVHSENYGYPSSNNQICWY
ncbi:MAG: hypothetical protein HF314_06855 [Ignavibacteria bacterium]|nr:hypothetical protein [Ignavibacteria bacterium]MCU7502775.1 hypothetical protein [Ignavibacteria bacterium]MCU7518189.1 hypothetical protein [Ignavibacteria bacterium]